MHVRQRDLNFIYFIKNFLAKHQTVRVVEDGEIMRHINKMHHILSFVFMEANDSENVKTFITIFSYLNSKYWLLWEMIKKKCVDIAKRHIK